MTTGVRIADLPDLGAVTDGASLVGELAGSGRFASTALRSYLSASFASVAALTTETAARLAGQSVFTVKPGAIGNGIADDAAAIQAAINAAAAAGGGTVWLAAGTYRVTATLVITTDDVKLMGAGHGGWHDTGSPQQSAATTLVWAGAAGGQIISIAPVGVRGLRGNGVTALALDPGAGGCAYGIFATSVCHGIYDVVGSEFSSALLTMTASATLSEAADCQQNEISLSGKNFLTSGRLLWLGGTATANVCFNTFRMLKADYLNGNAIVLSNADNNIFENIQLFRAPGGAGAGVTLSAAATAATAARANLFLVCNPGAGGIYAQGTEVAAAPSVNNHVLYYDKENGAPDPAIGSFAVLHWASNSHGIGFRRSSDAADALATIDNSGHVRQSGKTGVIGADGTLAVTLPIALASFTSVVSASPLTQPGPYCVTSTLTTLTISNGAAPNAFYWLVEGR